MISTHSRVLKNGIQGDVVTSHIIRRVKCSYHVPSLRKVHPMYRFNLSQRRYFETTGNFEPKILHSSFKLFGFLVRIPAIVFGTSASAAAYLNYKFDSTYSTFKDKLDFAYGVFNDLTSGIFDEKSAGGRSEAPDKSFNDNAREFDKEDEVDNHANGYNSSTNDHKSTEFVIEEGPSSGYSTVNSDDEDEHAKKEKELIKFSKLIMEVSEILKDFKDVNVNTPEAEYSNFGIPGIVVIGSQSSGKSSLLESVVGKEFLPKGKNMVTRRPIEISMVSLPDGSEEYCEFPQLKMGRVSSLDQVRQTLEDLNKAVSDDVCVSQEPIELIIKSSNVPDLRLVDLPGYIQVVNMHQPEMLKQKICDLCDKYIKSNNIILAVCAADVDLANSEALRASKIVDPSGSRTIGVITKIDLIEPNVAIDILNNKNYPLKLGYVGVVLKSTGAKEKAFFDKEPFKSSNCMLGLDKLKSHVRHVLQKSFFNSLKSITNAIQLELEDARYNFKVMYNDRKITSEGYTAETIEILKNKFREFEKSFQRPRVRSEVMSLLEIKCLELLFYYYWRRIDIMKLNELDPSDISTWNSSFESISSSMTKSGVGKSSVNTIVNTVMKSIEDISKYDALEFHTGLKEKIVNLASKLLKSNINTTIDQVENSIKPYKFEVECSDYEWIEARKQARKLLDKKIKDIEITLAQIQSVIGRRKLKKQMLKIYEDMRNEYYSSASFPTKGTLEIKNADDELNNRGRGDPIVFPITNETRKFSEVIKATRSVGKDIENKTDTKNDQEITDIAKQALILDCLLHVLAMRKKAIESKKCSTPSNKVLCPEVYLSMISEKLTNSAVMFIWIELLNDFFYQMPRSIDDTLYYTLRVDEMEAFASQNPKIKKHLDMLKKKNSLENALIKLREIRNSIAT